MIPSSQPAKRSLPEPFSRPKIEISEVKREWQWVLPETLIKNDVVPDLGLVKKIEYDEFGGIYTTIHAANGVRDFNADVKIWAFTRKQT